MDTGIQKNLGTLEEQLEKLAGLFEGIDFSEKGVLSDFTTPVLDELRLALTNSNDIRTSIEENLLWEKCFPLATILEKLSVFLVAETRKSNVDISLAWQESGKIPLSVAQGLMPSILSLLRVVVDRMAAEDLVARKRSFRLGTKTVVIRLAGNADFFNLKVIDDSINNKSDMLKYRKEFQKIRTSVAQYQGFCSFISRDPYGFEFEMKVPMPRSRVSALVLDYGEGRFALPMISVFDIVRKVSASQIQLHDNGVHYLKYKEMEVPICEIDSDAGIRVAERDFAADFRQGNCVIVGAADFSIALFIAGEPKQQLVRIQSVSEFVDKASWFKDLALFIDGANPTLAPYIAGEVVVEFQKKLQVRI